MQKICFVGVALGVLNFFCLNADQNPLVVQLLGTPASGKSVGEKKLLPYFSEGIQRLVKKAGDRAVDLDKIRESYAQLDGHTYFFLVCNALDLFSRAARSINLPWIKESYEELSAFVNDKFKKNFREICGHDIVFEDNGEGYKGILKIDGVTISLSNIGKILRTVKHLDRLFESFNAFELGNVINRYEHLKFVLEAFVLDENIKLDNVGTSAEPILGCLKTLRDKDFLTLSILIHPQTPLVNLFLNSMRVVHGGHYTGPDMLLKKYCSLEDVIAKKYQPSAEQYVVVRNPNDYIKLKSQTEMMNVEDNYDRSNINKVMDLLVIDNSANVEDIINKLENGDKKNKILTVWRASVAYLYDYIKSGNVNAGIESPEMKAQFVKYVNEMMEYFRTNTSYLGDADSDIEKMKNIVSKSAYLKMKWKNSGEIETKIFNFYNFFSKK